MTNSAYKYVHGYSAREIERLVDQAIDTGIIAETTWEQGIKDLYRATEADGTFCYTFFKGVAYK